MLIVVSALLIALCLFHSILGEKFILQRVKVETLPKMWNSHQATFRTIQATWHLVSVLWLGLALQFLIMTFRPDYGPQSLLIIFGVLFAGLAIVPLVWSAGKHKSWIAFGLIAVLLLAEAFI